MKFVCFNGKLISADEPIFTAQNRSFRYGDGLFETMKVVQNTIQLADYHFDRLFTGLRLLRIQILESLTIQNLIEDIIELCAINNCSDLARVRLAVFRNDANIAEYVIEALSLGVDFNHLNEEGFLIGLHPYVRKTCDGFTNLKTANYLPYVMAELYAKENRQNECLVLNVNNKICDASKANLFIISNNKIYTPALHQACVNGVMRRFIIDILKQAGYSVYQLEVDEELLTKAEEVFLTNALYCIRWVRQFKNSYYLNETTQKIYLMAQKELFNRLI